MHLFWQIIIICVCVKITYFKYVLILYLCHVEVWPQHKSPALYRWGRNHVTQPLFAIQNGF